MSLTAYYIRHILPMAFEVEYTDEFGAWWNGLDVGEQEDIGAVVLLLEVRGPRPGFPYTSAITTSRHSRMRELRVQHSGRPYRILYAFDPRRSVILLIGGEKTANDRWYEEFVPIADGLDDEHLRDLRKEGLI